MMIETTKYDDTYSLDDGRRARVYDSGGEHAIETWTKDGSKFWDKSFRFRVDLFTETEVLPPVGPDWACVKVEAEGADRPALFGYWRGSPIQIKLQNGPIKEVGVNGCQIDDVIDWCIQKIDGFNSKVPCTENTIALANLKQAKQALEQRRREREVRGVEGTSNA